MFAIDKEGCEKLIRFAFEVKKQPLLYLREKSLRKLLLLLQGFVYGYNNACAYGLKKFYETTKDGNVWLDFHECFVEKYKISSNAYVEVIEICGSDEKAFDLLFEELESYLREHDMEIPAI